MTQTTHVPEPTPRQLRIMRIKKPEMQHKKIANNSLVTYGSLAAAFGTLTGCYVIGMALHHWRGPLGYRVGSSWQAYAGLFVLTAGIERLIQPFSDILGDAPRTPGPTTAPVTSGSSLISPQIDTKSKKNTAIVTWGLASGLGCLACALLGVGLLTAIMNVNSSLPPPSLDVLVSGLVVGAGTKPLHDLITNIQTSKDIKQTQVSAIRAD
jgi:hypothetical protein